MSDQGSAKSWWHTLPGIITGVAAIITALTGLVAAIRQTGWFGTREPPAVIAPAAPAAGPDKSPSAGASRSSKIGAGHSVALPSLRDYKLGEATFTLLNAKLPPQTTEKEASEIRLRMSNHGRYDANFWDQSFRLIVDGAPMAPGSGLNELVPGQAAKEGDVTFVIPRGTTAAKLKITHADESTEIPLNLASPG
jgi:hypothetical protein